MELIEIINNKIESINNLRVLTVSTGTMTDIFDTKTSYAIKQLSDVKKEIIENMKD